MAAPGGRYGELGARLQAAESAMHLVRTLFALERRWTPYHDRLARDLEGLATQGWRPGELRHALLRLLQTCDPALQQQLESRVEALLRARGFDGIVERWGGEIERVKSWRLD